MANTQNSATLPVSDPATAGASGSGAAGGAGTREQALEVLRELVGHPAAEFHAGQFEEHLRDLGYVYTEETENPAYRMFLGD